MHNQRLNQLIEFLKEDPNDPFNLYAVALEYEKSDENKAIEYYDKVLSLHEDYIPAYYHAGKLYARLGNKDKAEEIYQKGIAMASKKNNHHALRELKSAYQILLGYDEEDD